MEDYKHLDEQIEKTQAIKFESKSLENDIEETEAFFPDYSMLEHPRMPTPPPLPAPAVLTVNQPTAGASKALDEIPGNRRLESRLDLLT
jgi:hypothetical protein